MQRTGVTQPGFVLELQDEGMPKHNFPSEFGSLFVEITVVFPATLTPEQEAQFRAILPK